jgi:Protein of unknown function (DUF2934)
MKQNKYPQDQMPGGEPRQITPATSDSQEIDFTPAQDAVARRAYFTYVNQGSPEGHDVQHWLEAEKQLISERDLTRVHGFHHRT